MTDGAKCGIIGKKGGEDTEKTTYFVGESEGGLTVREFLLRRGFSSSLIRRVKSGGITRGETPVRTIDRLCVGDALTVTLPRGQSGNIPPIPLPLDILCEDEEILVVKKPPQMPTHPSRGNHLPTLANAVAAYFAPRPFVFHAITRLDRDTEGLVLLAKDALSALRLSEAMARGEIRKRYLAVTSRPPSPAEGVIDAPIARESEGALRRVVRDGGKPARTVYRTLGQNEEGCALVELTPLTGRTHQLRVHMASVGAPLDADFLYGTAREGAHYRLAAVGIGFPHPRTGEHLSFSYLPRFAAEEFPDFPSDSRDR